MIEHEDEEAWVFDDVDDTAETVLAWACWTILAVIAIAAVIVATGWALGVTL
jgi:hypothetical protein